jgi:hypothetical protein
VKLITRRISSRHADRSTWTRNQLGDFMAAVRDGWMIALAIDMKLPGKSTV